MPIFASNFASNSLSGTARVVNGFANITLPTIPYALEGDKTFVIKIRKDSTTGDVLATSPVLTFRDNSSFVSLTANVSSVAEGNLVAFTLVTTNAVNGANLFYSVFPVTANVTAGDFTANTGTFTITNNAGTFALRANADVSLSNEDGETFRVQLRTTDSVGNVVFTTSNVVILDTYKTYNVLRFVESNASPIVEGSNVTFTFTATNIPAGTILYYNTTGNTTNFLSNTGSFVMNSTSNTIVISNPQVPLNTSRTYNVVVRSGSAQGPILATSNTLVILDGGLVYMNATGGTISDSGGFRTHTFTTSGNLVIAGTGLNPSYAFTEYLIVGGTGGDGNAGGFGNGGAGGGGVLVGNVSMSTGTVSVIVGADGAKPGSPGQGPNGSNTLVSAPFIPYSIYALGGGGGGGGGYPSIPSGPITSGRPGGSGGGGYMSGGGGSAVKPSITNALSYGNPGGGGAEGWGSGGGGGSSSSSGLGSNGIGGSGESSYYGQPAPANPGKGGWAGRGFDGGPLGFPGGPFGAGRAGNPGSNYETVGVGKALFKYPYVAGPTFNSITNAATYCVEGESISFTLSTTNLPNNTALFYSTIGNVTSSNFVSGNTGVVRSLNNSTTITLVANANIPTNEERYFQLLLNPDGPEETAAITSNVFTIKDDALVIFGLTGGSQSNISGYRVHTITSGETISVTRAGNIEILLVAGGGGGGSAAYGRGASGGGGAGGVYHTNIRIAGSLTVSVGGGGAARSTTPGAPYDGGGGSGTPSYISGTINNVSANTLTAIGGGGGGALTGGTPSPDRDGKSGGSGGGGGWEGQSPFGAGTPGQGNPGASSPSGYRGGGGGGAGAAGGSPSNSSGGIGVQKDITGNVTYYGGGGGGSSSPVWGTSFGGGGLGGGGNGGQGSVGVAGTILTGGGGGAGCAGTPNADGSSGGGGSGIVIIRYPV